IMTGASLRSDNPAFGDGLSFRVAPSLAKILLLSKRLPYLRDPQTRLAHHTRLSRTNSSLPKSRCSGSRAKARKRARRPRLPSHHDAEKSVAGEQFRRTRLECCASAAGVPPKSASRMIETELAPS